MRSGSEIIRSALEHKSMYCSFSRVLCGEAGSREEVTAMEAKTMIDINTLLALQGQFFMLLILGVIFRRRISNDAFQKGLTDLLVDLVLPCNILISFQMELTEEILTRGAAILAISTGIQLGSWGLAVLLYRKCTPKKRAVLQYGTICSNAGFLGLPIAEGLFASDGIFLTSIFLIPQRIFMWTVGVSFFTKDARIHPMRIIKNPCILAVLAGSVMLFAQIKLPVVLFDTIQCVSRCCTGLSMLLIGMMIADIRWKHFSDPYIWYYSAVRLLLIPCLTSLICGLFHAELLAANVSLILVSMPAAGTTVVLAAKYHADVEFSAGCVAVSTILSAIVLPLWCFFAL